ncbi:MAG: hypothetical protein IPG96_15280 [Proteobacteria bacterium]|nr:hypothetical protein [Pseudomonadota bacterium]
MFAGQILGCWQLDRQEAPVLALLHRTLPHILERGGARVVELGVEDEAHGLGRRRAFATGVSVLRLNRIEPRLTRAAIALRHHRDVGRAIERRGHHGGVGRHLGQRRGVLSRAEARVLLDDPVKGARRRGHGGQLERRNRQAEGQALGRRGQNLDAPSHDHGRDEGALGRADPTGNPQRVLDRRGVDGVVALQAHAQHARGGLDIGVDDPERRCTRAADDGAQRVGAGEDLAGGAGDRRRDRVDDLGVEALELDRLGAHDDGARRFPAAARAQHELHDRYVADANLHTAGAAVPVSAFEVRVAAPVTEDAQLDGAVRPDRKVGHHGLDHHRAGGV